MFLSVVRISLQVIQIISYNKISQNLGLCQEEVQQVQALARGPKALSSIPGAHIKLEREDWLQNDILWLPWLRHNPNICHIHIIAPKSWKAPYKLWSTYLIYVSKNTKSLLWSSPTLRNLKEPTGLVAHDCQCTSV